MTDQAPHHEMSPDELRQLAAMRRVRELRAAEGDPRRTYRHNDFLYDTAQAAFWCRPTASLVTAPSVCAMIPTEHWRLPPPNPETGRQPPAIPPSKDIARIEAGTVVEGSTWLPGSGDMVEDVFASNEGFFPVQGVRMFNTFRPGPQYDTTLAEQATPWVEHIKRMWPLESEHNFFFDYCAHMVQRPHEKSNSALVLSGKQGIGKDAALLPLRMAVGEWNCRNISPDDLLRPFNPWVECVMLTIDEVRPMSDDHRATSLYDTLKTLIATPPNTLALNQKGMKVRYVANVLRIFATTNDRLALYIPPDDRRMMVLHSELQQNWHRKDDPDYFMRFFRWLEDGGAAAVAGWLGARDISQYKPKGEVPKTATWAEISQRWDAPEDELTAALNMLGEPNVVLSSELSEQLFDGAAELRRMMHARSFVFRMSQAGYRVVPLPEGQSSWRRAEGGFIVKCNKAYIKESLGVYGEEAVQAVRSRLEARVAAGPGGKVPLQLPVKAVG